MIDACGLDKDAAILDMGGGASTLVDHLLAAGHTNLTVADISRNALNLAQSRLGAAADQVKWVQADACQWQPEQTFDLWHDRAVFHFLIEAKDRAAYRQRLADAVPSGGHLVMATFALDGPQKCSGLPIVQYDAAGLAAEIGADFSQTEAASENHLTPGGATQKFQYCRFRRN
ncbi:MAG: SAM-dependent methyltransferase [Robiginitomaculum sp.]|nr:MAG: SAM-dependent methyltransferase [Robiginitomaculum sp.]